jgi:HD domain-containing protein
MEKTKPQLLARAIAIAAEAHQRQLDKAGSPYILHPLRMMMRAQSLDEQIVAVLHDVVEDSDWTLEQVGEEGFGESITAALDCLTHRPDEGYDDYLDRILTNPLATQVKFYDLEDNMTLTRLSALTERDLERVSKYHQAHQRLLEALARIRA